MGRRINPGGSSWLFLVLAMLHDWCSKGRDMCYPVCEVVHIKEPLLLIGKSSPWGSSGIPFSPCEWSVSICLTPYNRKYNVLSASLNKTLPSFVWVSLFYICCFDLLIVKYVGCESQALRNSKCACKISRNKISMEVQTYRVPVYKYRNINTYIHTYIHGCLGGRMVSVAD